MSHPSVDKFGELVIVPARDNTYEFFDFAVKRHWKGPAFQSRQNELASLDPATIAMIRVWVHECVDHALATVLHRLDEATDLHGLQVLMDGDNVAKLSDGFSAEPYSDRGWYARFSKFGEPSDGKP